MYRKDFLLSSLGLVGASVLGACGDGGGGTGGSGGTGAGGDDPLCEAFGFSATIDTNHGHTLVLSLKDIEAGVDKLYDIQGSSLHTHTVTVTGAQFEQLRGGETVVVTSSTESRHSHTVTLVCGE